MRGQRATSHMQGSRRETPALGPTGQILAELTRLPGKWYAGWREKEAPRRTQRLLEAWRRAVEGEDSRGELGACGVRVVKGEEGAELHPRAINEMEPISQDPSPGSRVGHRRSARSLEVEVRQHLGSGRALMHQGVGQPGRTQPLRTPPPSPPLPALPTG